MERDRAFARGAEQLFQQDWPVVGSSTQGLPNCIVADTTLFGGVIKTLALATSRDIFRL
jgi:hypothetical protein